ncbi:MAG: DUF3179 domain-containing protein [Bacteroidota bacterium]
MKRRAHLLPVMLLFALGVLSQSCNDDATTSSSLLGDWLIPRERVFDGGPGKDGIPSLQSPEMLPAKEIQYLAPNDLVLGIKVGDETRAYPHPILDWHEIINDGIGNNNYAVTYCPLTGTGIGWNREVGGEVTTFGVSGLLFNTNLIPYDRRTDSNWSQMMQQSINGELIGQRPEFVLLVETTWSTWQRMYPNSTVTSTNTGISRNYGRYPYGDYRTSEDLIFPVENFDSTLPAKERVLGVDINGTQRAYRFELFEERKIMLDNIGGANVIIIGDRQDNFMVAFENDLPQARLPLELVNDGSTTVMRDALGNEYDFFGQIIAGPNEGEVLTPVNAYIGFWFAWAAFFPGIELVTQTD